MEPSTSETPVVEVVNLSKEFGKITAVDRINLRVERGEFLTLLGPSGCGKTTLLRLIAGLETPTHGRVLVNGQDVTKLPPERRPLNIVFQRYALFPHLSVSENVAFALRLRRVKAQEVRDRVTSALALVQLEGFGERLPHQLSGGQAQRVALARALVGDPEVLLLDEPLSALDRRIRQRMQDELAFIQQKIGTTFVYVTHDQEEAMSMSHRIALMRDGRVTELATPAELYTSPQSEFSATFVGDANVVEGKVSLSRGSSVVEWQGFALEGLRIETGLLGNSVRIMLRPETLRLLTVPPADERNVLHGVLVKTSFFGFYSMHHVEVGTHRLIVRDSASQAGLVRGQEVWLSVDPTRAVVLGERFETTNRAAADK